VLTRLSCRQFRDNAVWLQLFTLDPDLADFLRSAHLAGRGGAWTLTTLHEKLMKSGARIVRRGRWIRLVRCVRSRV
jgi:hypothetical protein